VLLCECNSLPRVIALWLLQTPKDQMIPPVDPQTPPAGDSPDSCCEPDFTHELTMGHWSVDLGLKVRDKRFPDLPKMIKNLTDGKEAATIVVSK
jgi:hypothetical protein